VIGSRQPFTVPEGWVARGFRLEVEPTSSGQWALIAQHFGARRFAYNWALSQVKANLDARAADPTVPPLAWNLPAIRREWNRAKHEVAPWWRACSKEAYASGIADLVAALGNWSDAKHGRRAGGWVGFPRFKPRRRDRGSGRGGDGSQHGPARVPPQRLPGRHRPCSTDAGLQDLAAGWAAAGGRPLVGVLQDPPPLRRLPG
jgi:Helix-turn-helix domain